MNAIDRIELAIRRAAAQMPNHQSRAFKLVADELAILTHDFTSQDEATARQAALEDYRKSNHEGD